MIHPRGKKMPQTHAIKKRNASLLSFYHVIPRKRIAVSPEENSAQNFTDGHMGKNNHHPNNLSNCCDKCENSSAGCSTFYREHNNEVETYDPVMSNQVSGFNSSDGKLKNKNEYVIKGPQPTIAAVESQRSSKFHKRATSRSCNGAPTLLVTCPLCHQKMASVRINQHLDSHTQTCFPKKHKESDGVSLIMESALKFKRFLDRNLQEKQQKSDKICDSMILNSLWSHQYQFHSDSSCSDQIRKCYYLRHFHLVVNYVMHTNPHLISEGELKWIQDFKQASLSAQKLWVRLMNRAGLSYSCKELSTRYRNDLDAPVQQFINELVEIGVLNYHIYRPKQDHDIKNGCFQSFMEQALRCATVQEVKEIVHILNPKAKLVLSSTKRSDLIQCIQDVLNGYSREYNSKSICSFYGSPSSPMEKFSRVADAIQVVLGPIVQRNPSIKMFFSRLFLIFNTVDGSTQTSLLGDLGKTSFYAYTCRISSSIFANRDSLIDYQDALKLESQLESAILSKDPNLALNLADQAWKALRIVSSETKKINSSNFVLQKYTSSWVYGRLVWHSVALLERQRLYLEAKERLYFLLDTNLLTDRRGKWFNRLSIVLNHHLDSPKEALQVCLTGLSEDEMIFVNRGERIQLAKRAKRILDKWKNISENGDFKNVYHSFVQIVEEDKAAWMRLPTTKIIGRPLDDYKNVGAQSIFIGYDDSHVSVEQLCLQYYKIENCWNGRHVEGSISSFIFGILMWDIIFMDVLDAFHFPFQNAPIDLGTQSFYLSRKYQIDEFLESLRICNRLEIYERMKCSHEKHRGISCRGVNWDQYPDSDEMAVMAACIGGNVLSCIFKLLCVDYDYWSGGFPDLFLWKLTNPSDISSGEAMFSEVKGPRDSLSEKQRAWIHELLYAGAKVEVIRVIENGFRLLGADDKIEGDFDACQLEKLEQQTT